MRYKLKTPSINQPLLTFEHMFSDQGQLILRGAFYEKYFEVHFYDPEEDGIIDFHTWDKDLEKEPIHYHNQISQDEYEPKTIFYIEFLQSYIKHCASAAIESFIDRMEITLNLNDQFFLLYSMRRKFKRFREYVETSSLICHRAKQLKWIDKIESLLISEYEKRTGFVSFTDQKLKPKDVEEIVGRLISDLDLSKDPSDLNKIVYFICSNNMTEYFGHINFGCSIWILKEIISRFQSLGFLRFTNVDILKTEFFRRNNVPLKIDVWNSSECSSEKNKLEVLPKLIAAFKIGKKV
jgi:hypothetical protein